MYTIENKNADRISMIFKNVSTGEELVKKAEDELDKYGKRSREETVRL